MPAMISNTGIGERYYVEEDAHLAHQTKHTKNNWRADLDRSLDDINPGHAPHRIPRSPLLPAEIGRRARASGTDIDQNPHEADDPRGSEWERGWLHHQAAEIARLGATP